VKAKIHKYIYLAGLCIIAFFLPLSEYITNAATLMIITNFLLELKFKQKLKKLWDNKSILIFVSIFFVHLLWLINTQNFEFAFNDIRIKLPLLALPIVIGASEAINRKQLNLIVSLFLGGVLISTLSGLFVYFDFIDNPNPYNLRDVSIFISHIRLSLMVCLSVLIIFYFMHERLFFTGYKTALAIVLIIWFVGFLVMIQGFTGLTSLVIVGLVSLAYKAISEQKLIRKVIYFVFVIGIPLLLIIYLGVQIKTFYTPTIEQSEYKTHTESGNAYYHDFESKLLENGNYIYVNICEKELYSEWSKRSEISLDGEDGKGQSQLHTLIRYLTSRGLTKDANGIIELSDQDIRNIENGFTNYRFVNKNNLNQRVYNIIWQIDVYSKGGNPSGHSITQRFEYLKAGSILAYRNIIFGLGTGDIDDAYKALYLEKRSQLDSQYRHRAHNQFLTFFVTFGSIGALLCLFAFFYPAISEFSNKNYYFAVFFLIAVLSMITDDTLETTTGVVFISYFYSLFLWGEK